MTVSDWHAILERQQHQCVSCGTTENLTIDHIQPLSQGGSGFPNNIQALCHSCNARKGEAQRQAHPSPLRDQQADRARALRTQGYSVKAIAAECGASEASVYTWLNPDKPPRHRSKYSPYI